MTKFKIYFWILVGVLCLILLGLTVRTHRALQNETRLLLQTSAERIYDDARTLVQSLIHEEEARSYRDYRYFRPLHPDGSWENGFELSPISAFPVGRRIPGLLGYFEVDPERQFRTPYLPTSKEPAATLLPNRAERAELEKKIFPIVTSALLGASEPEPSLRKDSAMNLQIFAGQTVEVDPFRVSSPDSRWLVFHRRVWRNNQRYLQGFVVNSERFFEALVQNPAKKRLYSTETVLHSEIRKDAQILPSVFSYQADLPPPLDGYRLVLSASSLPSHPTASLFIGMAVLMSVLLLGGAYAVYRIVSTEMVLSKKKSDFVASVSHELRTPLTSIRMFSEMLTDRTDLSDSKQAAYLKRIREESERLSRLVEGVLTLARIENNEWKIKLTQTNPEAVIRQVVERLDETVRTMGFELQLVKGSGPISDVAIDADAFSQMLTNLIENGVKFSKDAGTKRIEINLTQEADDCVVGVRDYGIGISPEEKKRIFERFYRAENEMTRHTRGTGIGLAMVKMLADRQNIQLDLVSYDPGTEFVLRLPAFQAST